MNSLCAIILLKDVVLIVDMTFSHEIFMCKNFHISY